MSRRGGGLAALRRFARAAAQSLPEVCDLCGVQLAPGHPHLLAAEEQRLACACRACALLFPGEGQAYRLVEPRAQRLKQSPFDDATWASLDVPTGLAFFLRSGADEELVARYPGPAGAVEAQLPAGLWERLLRDAPELADLVPEVEALLVHRLEGESACWLVSVDRCFHLVGAIRSSWRGLSGGAEVREAIAAFFRELEAA